MINYDVTLALSFVAGILCLTCLVFRRLRRRAAVLLGFSVFMFVASAIMVNPEKHGQVATMTANSPTNPVILATAAAPATVTPPPQLQASFVAAIDKWRKTYAAGANDMAKGAARPARAKEVCSIVKAYSVAKWIGTVDTLSSNGDGLGVLAVKIGDDVVLKTWNNSVSDASDHTMINPDSDIFRKASSLKVGQRVAISGMFIPELGKTTDCFREGSITLAGSLQSPEYIFRFSDIAAVD
jgi:hypothetical protein